MKIAISVSDRTEKANVINAGAEAVITGNCGPKAFRTLADAGVEMFCRGKSIAVLLRIPHERSIAEAYAVGRNLIDVMPEYSEKLVSLVRAKAAQQAERRGLDLVIIDGPPGVGCPVIASMGGVDMVLVVTEPTLSGLHDAMRIIALASHFNILTCVVINKCDINEDIARQIEMKADEEGAKVVEKIPYNLDFTKAQLAGKTIVEYGNQVMVDKIRNIWKTIGEVL